MCRHLGYLGEPATLHALCYAPAHSLATQAYAPRLQRHGRVNADGFGAGWYVAGRREPVRYRRAQPLWTDMSFASISEVLTARCAVLAIRCATPGFPVEESCAQPFTAGPWLFCHNGRVDDYPAVEGRLRGLAGDAAYSADARASVDSAALFALALARWHAGDDLGTGIATVVAETLRLTDGRLNLLASDGRRLAATAYGESLFVRKEQDAVAIASEPYDDEPGWDAVPDASLVTADASGVTVSPL